MANQNIIEIGGQKYRWFIVDEDGELCLLNLVPVMCCDEACEDYEEG